MHGDDARFYLVADESLARAIDDDAGERSQGER